ncbi:carboxylic ester hydrolase [Parastagonospora nodorum]|nr:carboxylic ester hydrolase [Parastagonospora nodorum]KAH4056353.1 carboxylic ester hydrolase [Parastagonospora nodorum]KAH4109885.1 carboxylic ester hydrolase [Parastagonospora nodorum]KAH4123531.1 carboxylic ester hydrolase [Parastagonospora nodorum]KAH4168454.1 carboxylic ester hydrolase [Parastagonospora nodorum]
MANFIKVFLFVYTCAAAYADYPWTYHERHLPIVDVGYGRYQASLNETGNYYNFSNIRYAEPPVGSLRFALPVSPRGRNTTVDTGSIARICPQAYPTGGRVNERYNTYYSLTGNTSIAGFENATQGFDYPRNTPSDPRATEDCLFLDVMVPREIFHARPSRRNRTKTGAAVMVWLHGGGFGAGSKYDTPAAGLISRSQIGDNEGVIYVTLNYRLGAFGWMSGPTFAKDGTPNAGLYDQRLALQWVRDNIHRFGGDPSRVTLFGESAGGGSIILQTTAFGGRRVKTPFQRAILQSPGWTPMAGNLEQEQSFRKFLDLLNVSTLGEARALPSIVLQAANELQIRTGTKGWTYGPQVDGDIIPALPSLLLAHGRYDDSIDVLVGHNGNEGFGYPVANESAFDASMNTLFPNAPTSALDHITKVLYPPKAPSAGAIPSDYDPETSKSLIVTSYNDPQGRQALFQSDTVIKCNTHFFNDAFKGRTYAYVLSVPPALHGQDLYYVFYNGQATDVYFRPINVTLAHIIQDYWINFANYGSPNGEGLPFFSSWGQNASVQGLSHDDVGPIQDPIDVETCRWWQLGLYV